MNKQDFVEFPVYIADASAFAAAMRRTLGDAVYDRVDAPRLAYRDDVMIVPHDWVDAATSVLKSLKIGEVG